jgi:hypothetical protein
VIQVYAYGSVPGKRADRRAVVVQILEPKPVKRTLTVVSWINPDPLPEMHQFAQGFTPGTPRVLESLGGILRCTANLAPPDSLPELAIPGFLATKQYRAFQHYTLQLRPSSKETSRDFVDPVILPGYTAPSHCMLIPPSSFLRGELSPANRFTQSSDTAYAKVDSLVKYRVGAAEEKAALEQATSFPGSLLFSLSMLPHVPWVWTDAGMNINPKTFALFWRVVASAFPTITIYVDGKKAGVIPQKDPSVLLGPNVRTADQPRETAAEELAQKEKPVSMQTETVRTGGSAGGESPTPLDL